MALILDESGCELISGKLDEIINSITDEYTQRKLITVLDDISSDLFMMNVLKTIELLYSKDEFKTLDDLFDVAKETYLLYRNDFRPDCESIKAEDIINGVINDDCS